MPLLISEKDVNWMETIDKIKIIVPLQSRIDVKTSILTTSLYLKVSSPPWLWECFLSSEINVYQCYARILENQVTFELRKKVSGLWKKLEHESKNCKSFQKERREQAFEENKKRLEETRDENATKKQEIHQASVRRQMQIDDRERKMVEQQKKAENERVADEIKKLREEQHRANEIAVRRKQIQQKSQAIPPTRKAGVITVSFTPRVFPTAARESKEAEEQEWLRKQAAATVSLKLDCEDLLPHEKNPEWLKEKADHSWDSAVRQFLFNKTSPPLPSMMNFIDFPTYLYLRYLFNKEDYQGAVNAYSLAIRMCPNMYSLYLGRSACHLQIRNLHKCIEDSSKALDLLHPPVPSNAKDRIKSHKIRGMAFRQLDLPLEGLMDFEAALKLDSSDEELKKRSEELRCLIQTTEE